MSGLNHRRLALVLTVGVMLVFGFFYPSAALPAPARSAPFLNMLHPSAAEMLSGVVLAGAPTQIPSRPSISGAIVLGPDVLVSGGNSAPQNEPEIATENWVDGLPHAAGANDYGTGTGDARCGAYYSTNDGTTWARAQGGSAQIPHPPALVGMGLNVSGDPDLAWGKERIAGSLSGFPVLYYSCLAFNRTIGAGSIFVSRSTDGGATWTSTDGGIVATGSAFIFNDKEFLAVDGNSRSPFQGNVYVCWTEFSSIGSVIKFRRSTTQATSWGPVVTISSSTSTQGCDVTVGPDGDVYVVYLSDAIDNSTGKIKVRRSTNGGVSFAAEKLVASVAGPTTLGFRVNNFPRITTDRQKHVFIVFSSNLTYGGVASNGLDIWSTRAGRSAGTWTTPKKGNAGSDSFDQFFPVNAAADNSPGMTATSHGTVHVCFMEKDRFTLGRVDTSCSHSHNDGAAWQAVQRVSDTSSFDGQFGGGFIGDYIGLRISGLGGLAPGHVHPVFPRNTAAGEMDIYGENATPPRPAEIEAPDSGDGP